MRYAIALAFCFALAGTARADKPMAAPAAAPAADAHHGMKSCADMIKEKAVLPAKMSEMLTAIAENIESHAKWMDTMKTKEAKMEANVLKKLAKSHRDMAASMKKTSVEMEKAGALPAAQHDMKTMDMKAMTEGMMKQMTLQKEMITLMQKDLARAEAMMKGMPAPSAGSK